MESLPGGLVWSVGSGDRVGCCHAVHFVTVALTKYIVKVLYDNILFVRYVSYQRASMIERVAVFMKASTIRKARAAHPAPVNQAKDIKL